MLKTLRRHGLWKFLYALGRLHGVGMSMALRHYLARGFKGLVSYVESTNFASLKSCSRMGSGCERFRFRVHRAVVRIAARPVNALS